MSGVTDNYGFITVEEGEAYDEEVFNANVRTIDKEIKNTYKRKQALYRMIVGKIGTPAGNGIPWGPLAIDTGKRTINNDFSQAVNTGTGNTAVGKIKILTAGWYDVHSMILPAFNPGNLNYGLNMNGEKVATDNRNGGTYGDWEMSISAQGIYMPVNSFIEGYQANSTGTAWGNFVSVILAEAE